MSRPLLAALAVPLLLAGCGWVSIEPRRSTTAAPAAPSPAVDAGPSMSGTPQSIPVQAGDTIYAVARRHNVPVRALIAANNLQAPYSLSPGQSLTLPPAQATHMVRPGDTLYGISRQYGVDATAVARANGLQPPYGIQAGQPLLIPGSPASVAEARPAPMPAARSVDPRPDSVKVDVVPLSPPGGGPVQSAPPPMPTATPPPMSARPSSGPVVGAALPPPDAPPPTPIPPPSPAVTAPAPAAAPPPAPPSSDPPPRTGRGFMRPVSGPVVAGFGPRQGGLHNDGINIAVPRGTPVRAAESGTVAYAGNELPGYGNLVLIKHADGWVSAYGHNDEIMVKRGQTVKRGETIAKVGSTGNVSQPQLHFELRRGARAVDPTPYLSGG